MRYIDIYCFSKAVEILKQNQRIENFSSRELDIRNFANWGKLLQSGAKKVSKGLSNSAKFTKNVITHPVKTLRIASKKTKSLFNRPHINPQSQIPQSQLKFTDTQKFGKTTSEAGQTTTQKTQQTIANQKQTFEGSRAERKAQQEKINEKNAQAQKEAKAKLDEQRSAEKQKAQLQSARNSIDFKSNQSTGQNIQSHIPETPKSVMGTENVSNFKNGTAAARKGGQAPITRGNKEVSNIIKNEGITINDAGVNLTHTNGGIQSINSASGGMFGNGFQTLDHTSNLGTWSSGLGNSNNIIGSAGTKWVAPEAKSVIKSTRKTSKNLANSSGNISNTQGKANAVTMKGGQEYVVSGTDKASREAVTTTKAGETLLGVKPKTSPAPKVSVPPPTRAAQPRQVLNLKRYDSLGDKKFVQTPNNKGILENLNSEIKANAGARENQFRSAISDRNINKSKTWEKMAYDTVGEEKLTRELAEANTEGISKMSRRGQNKLYSKIITDAAKQGKTLTPRQVQEEIKRRMSITRRGRSAALKARGIVEQPKVLQIPEGTRVQGGKIPNTPQVPVSQPVPKGTPVTGPGKAAVTPQTPVQQKPVAQQPVQQSTRSPNNSQQVPQSAPKSVPTSNPTQQPSPTNSPAPTNSPKPSNTPNKDWTWWDTAKVGTGVGLGYFINDKLMGGGEEEEE